MRANDKTGFYFVYPGGSGKPKRAPARKVLADFGKAAISLRAFNVGGGEAILLSRGAEVVLFDGGATNKRTNEPLGRSLLAYLSREDLKLRAIIATHPHTDHLNALSTILDGKDPPSLARDAILYHNGEAMPASLADTLRVRMNALSSLGRLEVEAVTTGTAGRGLTGVEMVHFVDGRSKPRPAYKSIITLAWYGAASFLFAGDVYAAYEEALLKSPIASLLRADVLKVTHHGSQYGTSQAFVDAVLPRISVASTADDEGHRLESVVRNRLQEIGTVFDTLGCAGDIIVRTDGKSRTLHGRNGVLYEVRVDQPGWYQSGGR